MHQGLIHPAKQDQEDDSDWEYEYHETETETYYVTLDLSSASTTGRANEKPKTSAASAAPLQTTTSDHTQDPTSQSTQATPNPEAAAQSIPELQAHPSDRIQILDFHTTNPLISYQNQLYTCTWTSTIGTDLLLTHPDPTSSLPKLKESQGFDVLAKTHIKLLAKPAQLIPRTGPRPARDPSLAPSAEAVQATPAPQTPIADRGPVPHASTGVTHLDLGPNPSPSRQNQAHFLSRLIAAKSKRGETDSVPVHSKRVHSGVGWRAQLREKAMTQAEQEQEEDEEDAGEGGSGIILREVDSEGEVVVGGSQSRGGIVGWRGATPRTRGLRGRGRIRAVGDTAASVTGRVEGDFADARPASADLQGTEGGVGGAGGGSTPTPRTWNQLAQGDRSGPGTTDSIPTADTDMAGAEGDGIVEANLVDAPVTASFADLSSGLGLGEDTPLKGDITRIDRGSAAGAVLNAPDVDIAMEDAP